MRKTQDIYKKDILYHGYDYKNQAWVRHGKYQNCGHPPDMDCGCYGREHAYQICTIKINENLT